MNREYKFVVTHIVLFVLCGIFLKFVLAADDSPSYKFLAGFLIGTYAIGGKEIAKLSISSFNKSKLPFSDSSPLMIAFKVIGFIIFLTIGLFAWFVAWEGRTGFYFGLAVFFAAYLSDEGLIPFIKDSLPV